MIWFLVHGYWPQQANHLSPECDNPGCCNPLHLYDGTQQQNVADAVAAGRNRGGSGNPSITAEVARAIYRRYAVDGVIQREVAAEFGVSLALVKSICRGKAWRSVTGASPAPIGRRVRRNVPTR